MKLFYVVSLESIKRQPRAIHVHANSPGEAVETLWPRAADMKPGTIVHVYDISQDALCPGRLDLTRCPREDFKFPDFTSAK